MTVRRRLVVHGRVQGVFYRESCRREAARLGIAGSARNRADGTVEVVIEGEADLVAQLERWCRVGPPSAVVTRVDVRDEPVEGLLGFRAG